MPPIVRLLRKSMILLVGLACSLLGASIFILQMDREALAAASTAELTGVLGLLLLPIGVIVAIELDRRSNQP